MLDFRRVRPTQATPSGACFQAAAAAVRTALHPRHTALRLTLSLPLAMSSRCARLHQRLTSALQVLDAADRRGWKRARCARAFRWTIRVRRTGLDCRARASLGARLRARSDIAVDVPGDQPRDGQPAPGGVAHDVQRRRESAIDDQAGRVVDLLRQAHGDRAAQRVAVDITPGSTGRCGSPPTGRAHLPRSSRPNWTRPHWAERGTTAVGGATYPMAHTYLVPSRSRRPVVSRTPLTRAERRPQPQGPRAAGRRRALDPRGGGRGRCGRMTPSRPGVDPGLGRPS